MTRNMKGICAALASLVLVNVAVAQDCCTPTCEPDATLNTANIGISGATLFKDFFSSKASTNDFIDVDCDGVFGPAIFPDQLAPYTEGTCEWADPALYVGPLENPQWNINYRGVGSVNGLKEFVDYQCTGVLPSSEPSGAGFANRHLWWDAGPVVGACAARDLNGSGSPLFINSVDLAVLDVPSSWGVKAGIVDDAAWFRRPTESGYGWNPLTSKAGKSNQLESYGCLNPYTGPDIPGFDPNIHPNADTVYDTQIAAVPIGIIANRGTGLEYVRATELQHLFVTGRMPNGVNLAGTTRDAGSGTRNGAMNSLCIDPSFGMGDNLHLKVKEAAPYNFLGEQHTWTNLGGSSIMEGAVQNHRLSVGYTGLFGGSRSIADAGQNKYELLNVMFDFNGGSEYVRPRVFDPNYVFDWNNPKTPGFPNVIFNGDPNDGWQIGGNETFVSRGDPCQTDPNAPTYMANQHAANYLRNILCSVAVAELCDSSEDNMPGEFLQAKFITLSAMEAFENGGTCEWQINLGQTQAAVECWLSQNSDIVPAYGESPLGVPQYGRVPQRNADPATQLTPFQDNYDGILDADYYNYHVDTLATGPSITGGSALNERNETQADMNGDGYATIADAALYVDLFVVLQDAYADPNANFGAVKTKLQEAAYDSSSANPLVPELLMDLDGDGNVTSADLRYAADGLFPVPVDPNHPRIGELPAPGPGEPQLAVNRAASYAAVDNAYLAATGSYPFPTTWDNGATYAAGDARFDVFGSAAGPSIGAMPTGQDGVIDAADVAYIEASFGDWLVLDQAQHMDLSCDMNGDLRVDECDVNPLKIKLGLLPTGDMNCDGTVDVFDINPFVQAILDPAGYAADYPCCDISLGDVTGDSVVDVFDINPFVDIILGS